MFLKCRVRRKDGKVHRTWSIVESRRYSGGKVAHRHVLYLGEINDSQREAWQQTIDVMDERDGGCRQMALFPCDHGPAPLRADAVQVRLSQMRLCRPRQWGACWLGDHLWRTLELDTFFSPRLGTSREGTDWEKVLRILVLYRLISPGSEWRLHRHWFDTTALGDLLGVDGRIAQDDTLYRGHDRLLEHKEALFGHLRQRWAELLGELAARRCPKRDEVLIKLGQARQQAGGTAAGLVAVPVDADGRLGYKLDRAALGRARLREGRYLLRTNLQNHDPATLWRYYIQLVGIEESFRTLKGDLGLRPVFHKLPGRIEAHLFVAFLAYCLSVTLRQQLRSLAGGLTPRAVLEKLGTIQMLDVILPTIDGRELLLQRHTEPTGDVALLLERLRLSLPAQPPPKIRDPIPSEDRM